MAVGAVLGAGAQDGGDKRVQVSAHAGLGASGWLGADTENGDGKFAYRVGVGFDFPISRTWGFRTGLNFEGLGETMSESESTIEHGSYIYSFVDVEVSSLYLEVPLMATARIDAGRKFDMVFNFGPYIGVGVGGRYSIEGEIMRQTIWDSGSMYGGENTFRRFDMGVGFGLSFEVKRLVFSIDNRIGFLHVWEGDNAYNYATFLGVGYKF